MKNYYRILGVDEDASKDDIKQAYRRLAVQHHPDKISDDKIFKEINEAQQVLLNDFKKNQYDSLLVNEKQSVFSFLNPKNDTHSIMNFFKKFQTPLLIIFIAVPIFSIVYYAISSEQAVEEARNAAILKENNAGNSSAYATGTADVATNEKAKSSATKDASTNQSEVSTVKNEIKPVTPPAPDPSSAKPVAKPIVAEKQPAKQIAEPDKPGPTATKAVTPTAIKATIPKPAAAPVQKTITSVPKTVVVRPQPKEVTVAKSTRATATPVRSNDKSVSKTLSSQELFDIVDRVMAANGGNKSKCVQVQKKSTSNVENAFDISSMLQSKGFVIAGRMTVPGKASGINIENGSDCLKLVFGTVK